MITSLADLPFPRRDPLALLHLEADRADVDDDFVGFGHGRVPAITLVARERSVVVRDALVLALHCTDPCAPRPDDVDLEFVLDEPAPGCSVSAPLSRFLDVWLPRVRGDERAVVLALCNPHRAAVALPASLRASATPLFYAEGDVESWYEDGAVRLVADAWRVAR